LQALHRYAETGDGHVKPLSGEFEGLLRLRVGSHRVLSSKKLKTQSLFFAFVIAGKLTADWVPRV
jgi:hypothetical protein